VPGVIVNRQNIEEVDTNFKLYIYVSQIMRQFNSEYQATLLK